MDLLDQQKEKEELNEIRGKLFANGFANPEEEIRRVSCDRRCTITNTYDFLFCRWKKQEKKEAVLDPTTFVPADADGGNRPLGFTGLKLGVGGSSSSNLRKVFNEENEDETEENAPSRPLVPLEYTEEEKRAVEESRLTAEEKKKMIKSLIEKIPTSKDELFKYTIDWTYNLIEKRLKPWVVKKIVEYIGEEEPSLVDFICQKVDEKASPQSILDDVSMVLDEEASVFVVKLWRLLIYEIEAKKIGIVKGDSQG
ncbi:unnamed protein product [Soboliphyme baturini]|uniref:PWI domain-containing protein n=1 Tax=Soboliphyme baturini TaxID=241478 RepID=A0A183IM48_9BILA|nr:unnamed protein product [Soboliphyme baturini]